ncbi:3(or 17)beta-hydroxysteroid dehydrogenase [Sphingosinicella soli]|uniref:3(Or 17)beta-hydroxysteroid dehydrogenase n=1 Tax=Sphingosinicella soli TaxID=333708 RepID=A0A7W7B643_9SPHN|nr:3(or 17)beta-hydroxysteroid dehydrogenase [Sphingosinicella soli]
MVVTDVTLEAAQKVADAIGNGAAAFALDVSSEQAWIDTIRSVEERFGRLDILVNNAGVVAIADVEESTLEQFRWVNAVMSEGVFLGCKHAIPLMNKGGGGSIVNMSSTGALLGYPIYLAYSAAKGAVRGMTKSIAVMCQEKGYKIRCNAVFPGAIETPMVQFAEGRAGTEQPVAEGVLPHGAKGAPKDIANIVLYLASDESRYVTGAEFVVDNGLTIRPW